MRTCSVTRGEPSAAVKPTNAFNFPSNMTSSYFSTLRGISIANGAAGGGGGGGGGGGAAAEGPWFGAGGVLNPSVEALSF